MQRESLQQLLQAQEVHAAARWLPVDLSQSDDTVRGNTTCLQCVVQGSVIQLKHKTPLLGCVAFLLQIEKENVENNAFFSSPSLYGRLHADVLADG